MGKNLAEILSVLLLASQHEMCFPGGAGRESIGKAGRLDRPAFIGLFGVGDRDTFNRFWKTVCC